MDTFKRSVPQKNADHMSKITSHNSLTFLCWHAHDRFVLSKNNMPEQVLSFF